MKTSRLVRVYVMFALLCAVVRPVLGFTQSGGTSAAGSLIPMGHEWITRLAALELLGGDRIMDPDPNDPRRKWTQGLAKNISLAGAEKEVARLKAQMNTENRYQSTYKAVLDAIIGERWVDIGGFNVIKSQTVYRYNAFDVVAQQPADIQSDHFMRRFDDYGADGGLKAGKRSQARFIKHFVDAAMAPSIEVVVLDGGGTSAAVQANLNYFLFGRAVHLFQDSFSSEHTVRLPKDNHERIRQVKAYLCSAGAEQHTHSTSSVRDFSSGDVIWLPGTRHQRGWQSYKPSNMKPTALVATEASKDLWAAFIRSMSKPIAERKSSAESEAKRLVENWLQFNDDEMLNWYKTESHRDATYVKIQGDRGRGMEMDQCMIALGVPSGDQLEKARQLAEHRRICLYNLEPEPGYADLFDPFLRIPLRWKWKSLRFETPPSGWKIPDVPANTGIRVRIKSALNEQYLSVADGVVKDSLVYARPDEELLEFVLVGTREAFYLRLVNAPGLFLSYRNFGRAVKLYSSPKDAAYQLEKVGPRWAIRNRYHDEYMWLDDASQPRITSTGDKK